MKIDETSKGYMIVRGKNRDQFFSFFVDHDSSSWTNYDQAGAFYDTKERAEWTLAELRRREKLKRLSRKTGGK